MTAFFGSFSDGCRTAAELVPMSLATDAMRLAALQTWSSGPMAFGCRPTWAGCDGIVERPRLACTGAVHLDNRLQLEAELGLGPSSDLDVLVAAYERWGWSCVTRLRGEWSFALWDKTLGELLLARDPTGVSAMFWWQSGRRLVFANELNCVLRHSAVPKHPNELKIACFLTGFDDPSTETATFYEGVNGLAAGAVLRFRGDGPDVHRWWSPDGPDLHFTRQEECLEAFLPLYRAAVGDAVGVWTGGATALALSSGLDSCSVMALAAPELAGRGHRLRAYVHRPVLDTAELGAGLTGDEFDLASKAAEWVGAVDVEGLHTSDGACWSDGPLNCLQMLGQPNVGAGNFHWMDHLVRRSSDEGARMFLTGQGGNGTVSWIGTGNLWPLLRQRRWGQAGMSIARGRLPVRRAIRRQVLSPLWQPMKTQWRTWRNAPIDWAPHSFIHPDLARRTNLRDRMRAVRFDIDATGLQQHGQMRVIRRDLTPGGQGASAWVSMGNRHGLMVRDPTRDQRIVEFCWRLPDRFYWGDGSQRMLIRQGFEGLLPGAILRNPCRGVQSSDLVARIRRDADQIVKWLSPRDGSEPRWIDVTALRRCAAELQQKLNFSSYEVLSGQMLPALSVMLFADGLGE